MTGEASETAGLLRRAAQGDQAAWGALLVRSRDRLRRMVRAAARPPPAGPGRPLRHHPGGLHRRLRPAGRVRPAAGHAVLPLAAVPHRPAARAGAPPAPRRRDARRRAARSRSIAAPCPRRPPPPWRRSSWAATPAPARRPSAPSGASASRRRSTAWTRSTARSWPCATSSN